MILLLVYKPSGKGAIDNIAGGSLSVRQCFSKCKYIVIAMVLVCLLSVLLRELAMTGNAITNAAEKIVLTRWIGTGVLITSTIP